MGTETIDRDRTASEEAHRVQTSLTPWKPSLDTDIQQGQQVAGHGYFTLLRNHVIRPSHGTTCGLPSVKTAKTALSQLRVAKTYAPEQNGAKRFARRYGDNLVCVRHRLSDDGGTRHTTVELLVESTPVASRARSLVALRIAANDKSTRTILMACGAQWKPKEKYWLLPRMVAKNLRLLRKVVPLSG